MFFGCIRTNLTSDGELFTTVPWHDPVTWYEIYHAGAQITQWDFQNKGILAFTSPAQCYFVLKVQLHYLRPSIIYFVPCDRIVQRAYNRAWKKCTWLSRTSRLYCQKVTFHFRLPNEQMPWQVFNQLNKHKRKLRLTMDKRNLRAAYPKGKLKFKFFSSFVILKMFRLLGLGLHVPEHKDMVK